MVQFHLTPHLLTTHASSTSFPSQLTVRAGALTTKDVTPLSLELASQPLVPQQDLSNAPTTGRSGVSFGLLQETFDKECASAVTKLAQTEYDRVNVVLKQLTCVSSGRDPQQPRAAGVLPQQTHRQPPHQYQQPSNPHQQQPNHPQRQPPHPHQPPPNHPHRQPPNVDWNLLRHTKLTSTDTPNTKKPKFSYEDEEPRDHPPGNNAFRTARQRFLHDNNKRPNGNRHSNTKQLGMNRRRTFRPPARTDDPAPPPPPQRGRRVQLGGRGSAGDRSFNPAESTKRILSNSIQDEHGLEEEENVDPRLKGIDPALIERIESEILDSGSPVSFDDIAGLDFAKQNVEEAVVWPIRNPELYTGLRQLPKGLLLFGPPGTGKTMIGKAIAHEVNATFFSISASSLTSKWIGEGEKTVRAMFGVAGSKSPSVVFIDEIDSLLCQRSSDENEASRRIKTEFLVQLDGAATVAEEMVLVIGATNRPQELDEAARRRFVKRLYIPLPEADTRASLLRKLMAKNEHDLTDNDLASLTERTKGYSGADITNLAREASMGPLREYMMKKKKQEKMGVAVNTDGQTMRPISVKDFTVALRSVRASVSKQDLTGYVEWNEQFGTQQYVGEDTEAVG